MALGEGEGWGAGKGPVPGLKWRGPREGGYVGKKEFAHPDHRAGPVRCSWLPRKVW